MRQALAMLVGMALTVVWAGPAGAAADTTKPRVQFTTADESVLIGAPIPHELAEVRGTATDARGSGIRKVRVTWCGNAERTDGGWTCGTSGAVVYQPVHGQDAALTCSNDRHRRCQWSIGAPLNPGRYLITATAIDRAGNRRSTGPLFVTVA